MPFIIPLRLLSAAHVSFAEGQKQSECHAAGAEQVFMFGGV